MSTNTPECERIRKNLSAFLDGELAHEEAEEVRGHLDQCPLCRAEKRLLQESWKSLERIPVLEVGDAFDRALFQRLCREEGYPPAGRHPRGRLARVFSIKPIAAAASILILVGIVLLSRPSQEIKIPPQEEKQIISVLDILEDMELLETESNVDLVELLHSVDYEALIEEEES